MIRSSVTISLVNEARGGPFVFWDELSEACRTAKELGFDAVEIFPPAPDAVDPTLLRRLLGDNGLALAAVGTGAGWVRPKFQTRHGEGLFSCDSDRSSKTIWIPGT
jgi:sugar phosphate isomerase/epimerase